ncbi:MAG: hypothetical protein K2I37_03050 [Muribaculaceae bacterium]|nr:hypothetical protein [Muribaculaceae bacterium]
MDISIISQNPYRILGVLSNSPLKDRVGNQNRLAAFSKIGKEISFPNDFTDILVDKPIRTHESVSAANAAINLDKDRLKYALFWFVSGSPLDEIALKHLQAGNREKAKEIFLKKETYSSLINSGVLALVDGNIAVGFNNISKVVHNTGYRAELIKALGISNLQLSEDDFSELMIAELLKEIPASKLLSACTNDTDRAIISKSALDEPISAINSAISIAKDVDSSNPEAILAAGTKLMNSTKAALHVVKEIAGATSPQYQMVADNVAKQVLQCGINYYNNAPDSDVESPRKAMVLQSYALQIAVGQLTKDRCKENYDILKKAVDNMPPAEVAIEARKVKEELKKFCQLPDKISHSMTLLRDVKPWLQAIKLKLGASNSFYLSLSTQVVDNALHNVIEEVNHTLIAYSGIVEKFRHQDRSLIGTALYNNIKQVVRNAWNATLLMDSFDMDADFKTNRYNPNRQSLKEMCEDFCISTSSRSSSSSVTSTSPVRTSPTTSSHPASNNNFGGSSSSSSDRDFGCLILIIFAVGGGIIGAVLENFLAGFIICVIVGGIIQSIYDKYNS